MSQQVMLRCHAQPGGECIASVTFTDGRVFRVVGGDPDRVHVRIFGIERAQAKQRELVLGLLKDWVTWERRGRP
jgi:hypothetical protein